MEIRVITSTFMFNTIFRAIKIKEVITLIALQNWIYIRVKAPEQSTFKLQRSAWFCSWWGASTISGLWKLSFRRHTGLESKLSAYNFNKVTGTGQDRTGSVPSSYHRFFSHCRMSSIILLRGGVSTDIYLHCHQVGTHLAFYWVVAWFTFGLFFK